MQVQNSTGGNFYKILKNCSGGDPEQKEDKISPPWPWAPDQNLHERQVGCLHPVLLLPTSAPGAEREACGPRDEGGVPKKKCGFERAAHAPGRDGLQGWRSGGIFLLFGEKDLHELLVDGFQLLVGIQGGKLFLPVFLHDL